MAGRSRGEQTAGGTYNGHITIAALFGQEIVGVDTGPGETQAGPLDAVQQNLLNPLCDATQQGICLRVLTADSATTATGSTNHFEAAGAEVGGPTGIRASAARSNGNISQTTSCQSAHGDSAVTNAAVGSFSADMIESSSDSRECRDGTQTVNQTSWVVRLGATGLAVPPLFPEGCANGTPNSQALIPLLAPAICHASDSNAGQADVPYGVREGLTTFVLDVGTQALIKSTTAAAESRARMKAQCSDGIDNDGNGSVDLADPACSGPTDDSEAGGGGAVGGDRDDGGGRDGGRDRGGGGSRTGGVLGSAGGIAGVARAGGLFLAVRRAAAGRPVGRSRSAADCPLGRNLISLTAADDTRKGTRRSDRIFARSGDDVIDGRAGDDCIDLGPGDDEGRGGRGDDRLLGRAGEDRIDGGRGGDRIDGGGSRDVLRGGRGDDLIIGGAGRDRISCGPGRDRVVAGRRDRVARDCESRRRG